MALCNSSSSPTILPTKETSPFPSWFHFTLCINQFPNHHFLRHRFQQIHMPYPSHSIRFLIRCRILFKQSCNNNFHSFLRKLLHFIQMRKQLLRQHQIIKKYRFLLLQEYSAHSAVFIQNLIFHRFQFDCRNEIISHRHTVFLILHCIFLRKSLYF